MLKECKTKECHNKLQQLKWKEQEKEKDQYKREMRLKKLKKITGIKNKQAMARDDQEWRKTALEAKVHNRV
jgi:hypothetical protein